MKSFKENLKNWLIPASSDTNSETRSSVSTKETKKKSANAPRVFMLMNYNEAQEIANHLLARQDIIVNVSNLITKDKYRVIDFLSGVIYALEGKRLKLEPNIYLFSLN